MNGRRRSSIGIESLLEPILQYSSEGRYSNGGPIRTYVNKGSDIHFDIVGVRDFQRQKH